ncbi:Maltose acetyltransferase family protein [Penicillium digitatum]|uniref:Maltose acetyltransferase family protein n=1 Tax=Penicillium digitatum TaxID=36651 RepID=A0A7T6XSY8_PENDI|nr:Maltose acetyltransferase family protein [Penicillium digitatum]
MAQALRASRQSADDLAVGFFAFRDPLPEHVGEIASLMSELYAISSTLTTLERLAEDPRNRRYFEMIKSDLNVVQASFTYTVEDIGDFFRDLDDPDAGQARYKRTWIIMSRFFWDQSNYTLAIRLAKYKTVFQEFNDLVREGHYTSSILVDLISGFKTLLSSQDSRFAARFEGMTLRPNDSPTSNRASPPSPVRGRPLRECLVRDHSARDHSARNHPARDHPARDHPAKDHPARDHPARDHPARDHPARDHPARDHPARDQNTRRQRSYERTRPPHMSPPPMSSSSTTSSDIPPSVPDIPLSPLTSASATTATSQSTEPDIIKEHWAKDTFGSSSTSTPLPSVREKSHCRGEPHPGIKQSIKDKGFEELLQLSLNDESEMRVSFYLRRTDRRVRILCKEPHRTRPSDYHCLPLNLLEVLRDGSCLRLCRRRNRGTELVLWTQLKFTTLEDLVLFHNTFLALRSQDEGHPIEEILDHELAHEQECFGGTITDDDYVHALRVYKDTVTGAVRLQASVYLGDMNHTPVWTAFVTHNLGKRKWLKLYDSKTVIMRDTKPVVFISMDEYTPLQTSQGHHVLEFTSSSDAKEFLDVMDELGD